MNDPLRLPLAPGLTDLTRAHPNPENVWPDTLIGIAKSFLGEWSMSSLARAAGVDYSSVRQLVRGRGHISLDVGLKIATAMGIPPRQVLAFAQRAWAARTAAEGKQKPYRDRGEASRRLG